MKKMQCFYLLKKLLITDSVPEIGFSCIYLCYTHWRRLEKSLKALAFAVWIRSYKVLIGMSLTVV